MTTSPHRVTADHIRGLAVEPGTMREDRTVLADTNDGIRLVGADAVLTPGSGVRRLLLTHVDLVQDAAADGLTLAAYVRKEAGRIAREINEMLSDLA